MKTIFTLVALMFIGLAIFSGTVLVAGLVAHSAPSLWILSAIGLAIGLGTANGLLDAARECK